MKTVLAMALAAIMSLPATGKVVKTVDVSKERLSLNIQEDEKNVIDSLFIISGSLKDEDYTFMKEMATSGRLKGIDMSAVGNFNIPDNAFASTHLQYIRLGQQVRNIGEKAFANTDLRVLTIPNTILSIGKDALSGCHEMRELNICRPAFSAPEIADDVKGNITLCVPEGFLASYRNDASWGAYKEIKEKKGLFNTVEVTLSDGVSLENLLGDKMMTTDSLVVKGEISKDNYNDIGKMVGLYRLCSVNLGMANTIDGKVYGMRYSLPSVNLVYRPARLRNIIFPKNATNVESSFEKAYFQNFNLPSTVKCLGGGFSGCTIVSTLVLPEGVEELGRGVFEGVNLPRKVYFPSTLAKIPPMALFFNEKADNTLDLYYNRMTPPVYDYSDPEGPFFFWNGCMPDCWTLYVPVGAKKYFAADKYWGCFPNIVETPELDGGTSGIGGVSMEDAAADNEQRIYTLDGRYVGKDMERLGKGVYVVGGRKVVR